MTQESIHNETKVESEPKKPAELFRDFIRIAGRLVIQTNEEGRHLSEHDEPNLLKIFKTAGYNLSEVKNAIIFLQGNSFEGFSSDELEHDISVINNLALACDESELDEDSDVGTTLLGARQILSSLIELRKLKDHHL